MPNLGLVATKRITVREKYGFKLIDNSNEVLKMLVNLLPKDPTSN